MTMYVYMLVNCYAYSVHMGFGWIKSNSVGGMQAGIPQC